ncbi:MAG: DUF167 domain-containing protein [Candidatus Komeilibacteria bacterium]|nr:DUF167 domain-containing protein [Candidatus Komeilibacteria bacterium]
MKKSATSGRKVRRYRIIVTARASRNTIEQVPDSGDPEFRVWVTAVPERGKANTAALDVLARHLGIRRGLLNIVSGHTQRHKIIEVSKD